MFKFNINSTHDQSMHHTHSLQKMTFDEIPDLAQLVYVCVFFSSTFYK